MLRNYTFRLKPGQDSFDSISLYIVEITSRQAER